MCEKIVQLTQARFAAGHLCSESVLLGYAEACGLEEGHLLAMATGVGAGFGCSGGLCGAIGGAALAIGLARGRSSTDDDPRPSLALVGQLLERFVERFGSTDCRDLIGCDISTEQGIAEAWAMFEAGESQCGRYCAEAAAFLAERVGMPGQRAETGQAART